jgi:hypothetical protein
VICQPLPRSLARPPTPLLKMSDDKVSFDGGRDVEKTGLPMGGRTVTFHNDAVDTHAPVLERAATIPGRAIGLSQPEGTGQATNLIPIGYRTLSIQVYDSQRFDPPKGFKKDEDDADFFGKLDYHCTCR